MRKKDVLVKIKIVRVLIWSFLRKQAKRAEGTLLIGLRVSPVRDSEFPTGPSRKHVFRMKFGP